MTRPVIALVLLTVVSASAAQPDPQWLQVMSLPGGTAVTIGVKGLTPIAAHVISADGQVLNVVTHGRAGAPDATIEAFPRGDIEFIALVQQPRGCKAHMVRGILLGALVGGYLGAAIGARTRGTEIAVGVGSDIGAVAGGFAGARIARCRPIETPIYRRPAR